MLDERCRGAAANAPPFERDVLMHELRTPLHAVIGLAELIRRHPQQPQSPPLADWLSQIALAGQHMLQLIEQASGVDTRGPLLQHAPLCEAALDAAQLLRPQARAAGVLFELPPRPAAALAVVGSATVLRQIFINLLSNAIKYTPPGGLVAVGVAAAPDEDGMLRATVRDTGLGMNAEQMARLYTPYDRLGREAGLQPGSGIGLYTTRRLVLSLGGSLAVHSEGGVGTTVTLLLHGARPERA